MQHKKLDCPVNLRSAEPEYCPDGTQTGTGGPYASGGFCDVAHDMSGSNLPNGVWDGAATPEPLVLRASAGDCIEVTLRNKLLAEADEVPDLAGYNTLLQVVNRRIDVNGGLTTFNNNLVAPSAFIGLHPQLVAYDASRDDGALVGRNAESLTGPRTQDTVRWYAGDIDFELNNRGRPELIATPVEFGGANLSPADRIKQGQKALVGALIIEPEGATWTEDPGDPASATVDVTTTATAPPIAASATSR